MSYISNILNLGWYTDIPTIVYRFWNVLYVFELKWNGKATFFLILILGQYWAIYWHVMIYHPVNEMKNIDEINILLIFWFFSYVDPLIQIL